MITIIIYSMEIQFDVLRGYIYFIYMKKYSQVYNKIALTIKKKLKRN